MFDEEWRKLSAEILCWEGVNALGEDLKTKNYVVYYDRTVWTEEELRERLRPLVTNVQFVPQDPVPDYE